MAEILSFEARRTGGRTQHARKPAPPRLHDDVRRHATLFAGGCSVLLALLGFGLAILIIGVLA